MVFALPQSPMAQPWTVIAGNALSALVGISVTHLVGEPLVAMPLAAGISILDMFTLWCLYPPAAAVSLIVFLGVYCITGMLFPCDNLFCTVSFDWGGLQQFNQ